MVCVVGGAVVVPPLPEVVVPPLAVVVGVSSDASNLDIARKAIPPLHARKKSAGKIAKTTSRAKRFQLETC